MTYFWLKFVHILSVIILLGTGLGTAFWFYRANVSRNLAVIHFACRNVLLADFLFTVPTVFIVPWTGYHLIQMGGFAYFASWILLSLFLYVVAGVCWLAAFVLQWKMKKLASHAFKEHQEELPVKYWEYERQWFWLGVAAFPAVGLIFFLMLFKPFLF